MSPRTCHEGHCASARIDVKKMGDERRIAPVLPTGARAMTPIRHATSASAGGCEPCLTWAVGRGDRGRAQVRQSAIAVGPAASDHGGSGMGMAAAAVSADRRRRSRRFTKATCPLPKWRPSVLMRSRCCRESGRRSSRPSWNAIERCYKPIPKWPSRTRPPCRRFANLPPEADSEAERLHARHQWAMRCKHRRHGQEK